VALTGVAFTDTYPASLTGIAASASPAGCTGTLTGTASAMTLTTGVVPAGTTCVYTTTVTATSAGVATNVTGPVSSSNAPNGTSASDSVNIYAPPTLAKSFGAASVTAGGQTTLVLFLSNVANNPGALSGVRVDDSFPAGLTLANTTFVFTPAACGTVTKISGAASASGDNNVRLNVASLATGSSCQANVNVTSSTVGSITNLTQTPIASGPVSLSGSPATASLTIAPTVSDMTPIITLPSVGAPGAVVSGQIVCSNSGPNTATNATCTATAVDSLGNPVTITVGTCTPSNGSTLAAVLNGGTLTCSVSYTVPGTAGGSDTTPVSVIVTARTGADNDTNGGNTAGGNNSTSVGGIATIIDAVNDTDAKLGGSVGATTTLTTNDQFPVNSTFNLQPGGTCTAPAVSAAGVATYNVPATGACTINYQVCAPAPNLTVCDIATLTVTAILVPVPDLALTKTSTSTFTVGANASFTLTPNNLLGTAATSGVVTATDTLPAGLTYVAAGSGGSGWTCSVLAQVVTCTSTAVIAAGGTGTAITINVSVNSTAVPSVTNVASVSGVNEPAANTGNNSALLTVPVGNAPVNTFTTDGAQTGLPGTSVFYPHTFNAGSSGTVLFSTTQAPNPNIAGWITTTFRDANCNGTLDGADGTTPITAAIAVNAGDQVCIIVRNDIPAAASFNAQDVLTNTATFTPTVGPVINYTRQDVTTVVLNGGLTLTKSVRNVTQGGTVGTNNTAKPGDVLEYIVTYTNTANAPVSMIVVTDTTPVFTTFVSAVCNTPLPAALTSCNFTAPTVGSSGNIVWTLSGSLNALQSGTVAFRVTVQ
jgi:mucin-19